MSSYPSHRDGSGYSSGYGQGSHSRSGYDGARPSRGSRGGYSSDYSGRGRSRSSYDDSRSDYRGESRGGDYRGESRGDRGPSKRSYDTTSYTSDGITRDGCVKWFNSTKGYGFITPDDGSPEIFVHHSGIAADGFRSLTEGDKVTYCTETGSDGRHRACNVHGPSYGKRSRNY